jgi:uncharacterized protein
MIKKHTIFLITLLFITLVFLGITLTQPFVITIPESPIPVTSYYPILTNTTHKSKTILGTKEPIDARNFPKSNEISITPSLTALHPLTIEYLRQQSFPPSEIVIEENLEQGQNYSRLIVSYRSEGLKIFALMTVPEAEKPQNGFPVIVFNHGYIPPTEYRTTQRYEAYVDALARSGYIVFRSDYRGHGNSEGVPINAYGSPGYTIDILNAVSALRKYRLSNPDQIGMWGHSMGGWITLRAMVVDPDIKAGVIWAGMVASYPDLLTKWRWNYSTPITTPTELSSRQRWLNSFIDIFGDPQENPENWAPLSANSYLDQLSSPIQLHHGDADTEVPIEFSITLFEHIQEVDGMVEFFSYPGDNHNISNNFSLAMYRSIDFFNRYIKEKQ